MRKYVRMDNTDGGFSVLFHSLITCSLVVTNSFFLKFFVNCECPLTFCVLLISSYLHVQYNR